MDAMYTQLWVTTWTYMLLQLFTKILIVYSNKTNNYMCTQGIGTDLHDIVD